MSFLASSSAPLWLMPISAITKTRSPGPTRLVPMRRRGAVMGVAPSRGSPAGPAAVDDEVGAGHVSGRVRTEKDQRAAVVVGARHASERGAARVFGDEE